MNNVRLSQDYIKGELKRKGIDIINLRNSTVKNSWEYTTKDGVYIQHYDTTILSRCTNGKIIINCHNSLTTRKLLYRNGINVWKVKGEQYLSLQELLIKFPNSNILEYNEKDCDKLKILSDEVKIKRDIILKNYDYVKVKNEYNTYVNIYIHKNELKRICNKYDVTESYIESYINDILCSCKEYKYKHDKNMLERLKEIYDVKYKDYLIRYRLGRNIICKGSFLILK